MSARKAGTFVLVGGGEFGDGCRDLDAELVSAAATDEVVVLPTAAAFEHPERVGERAEAHFAPLGATVRTLPVLHRGEAEDADARRGRSSRGLRVPRRRVPAPPPVGAEGFGAVRRAARRVPRRRRPRRVRCRRHGVVRPDGRPAGRRVHRRPRRGAQPRRVPLPRHRGRPPPRALDRPAAQGRHVGGHRRGDGARARRAARGASRGAGAVTVYDGATATAYEGESTIEGLPS